MADKALHETVENFYHLDPDVRRLRTVAAFLPIGLRPQPARWIEGQDRHPEILEVFLHPRGDLPQSDMLQTVAETCGTMIFLANPRMDREPIVGQPFLAAAAF